MCGGECFVFLYEVKDIVGHFTVTALRNIAEGVVDNRGYDVNILFERRSGVYLEKFKPGKFSMLGSIATASVITELKLREFVIIRHCLPQNYGLNMRSEKTLILRFRFSEYYRNHQRGDDIHNLSFRPRSRILGFLRGRRIRLGRISRGRKIVG